MLVDFLRAKRHSRPDVVAVAPRPGRSAVAKALLGSTSAAVARGSPCAVLLVRPRAARAFLTAPTPAAVAGRAARRPWGVGYEQEEEAAAAAASRR